MRFAKSTLSGNIFTLPDNNKRAAVTPTSYGPNDRTDAKPPHQNVIRRFREELRMDRIEFAVLLDAKIDTLRVWEAGKSKPRGAAAIKIIEVAGRNEYPMSMEDIYPPK